MNYKWISLFGLFIFYNALAQVDTKEEKVLQNEYGEIVYGNKQFPIVAFFQKDSLKYIYSQSKNKIAILRQNNTILQEITLKNKDFSTARFQPYGNEGIILQSWGMDKDYFLIEKQKLSPQKRTLPSSKKIIAYKEVSTDKGKFEVHQYMITPTKKLSKVLIYKNKQKIDTLYKDTITKENRYVNVSPRAELVYFQNKLYFFNADQRLLLVFDAQNAQLLEEINLKEKDEYLSGFILNFYVDITTSQMYVGGVVAEKTYLWKIGKEIERYEIPFQIYSIHQIYSDKIYFSLKAEEIHLYVYERKFR
ncbi:MAG: hypothetical protein OHK0045_25620 [Raineya sp.]